MKTRKYKPQGKYRILTWHQCDTNLHSYYYTLQSTCGCYKFHHACSKLYQQVKYQCSSGCCYSQDSAPIFILLKTCPFFQLKILISFQCLFFSKLCQQNIYLGLVSVLSYILPPISHGYPPPIYPPPLYPPPLYPPLLCTATHPPLHHSYPPPLHHGSVPTALHLPLHYPNFTQMSIIIITCTQTSLYIYANCSGML